MNQVVELDFASYQISHRINRKPHIKCPTKQIKKDISFTPRNSDL